jgi:VIT1/CCC1 family predicted Fe2+/Mn2+ transporter
MAVSVTHPGEPHRASLGERLNWLRAGVLGANDGIVSVAGVAGGGGGATPDRSAILVAGVASLVAGALSMAGGEYVSVSTQRDTEQAALRLEKYELETMPEEEERELAEIYQERGLSPGLAAEVAHELTENNALEAHAQAELGIDPDGLTSPWHAAWASLAAFTVGGLLPLLAIAIPGGGRPRARAHRGRQRTPRQRERHAGGCPQCRGRHVDDARHISRRGPVRCHCRWLESTVERREVWSACPWSADPWRTRD